MSRIFDDLFIFEMANSHQGSVEHGKDIIHEMGKIARKYNIKAAVKLQYRNLDTFIHPDYKGRTDVNHIPRFESTRLTYDQFSELVAAIRDEGMIAMSTPFDEDGVDWCMDQGLDIIKVASCSSLDWPLLEKIASTHKPVIISVGGKTISDIDKIYNYFTHKKCEFAFMHCIAEYPAPMERLQLDFIDKLKRTNINLNQLQIFYAEFVVELLRLCRGHGISAQDVGMSNINTNEELTQMASMDEFAARLSELSNTLREKIGSERLDSTKKFAADAKQYIADHYSESKLSVDEICSHLGVGTSYFSSVFKKEMGKSFVTYLTEVRMNEAQRLLDTTDEKSYIIAGMVGYEEPNYFSYVFKKHFGVSPSKYRQ